MIVAKCVRAALYVFLLLASQNLYSNRDPTRPETNPNTVGVKPSGLDTVEQDRATQDQAKRGIAKQGLTNKKTLSLRVAIISVSYEKYLKYLTGDICANLSMIEDKQVDRPVVELILICQAFQESGYAAEISLKPTPNYSRSLRMAESGEVHTIAESIWSKDLVNADLYSTHDVIRLGEFEKGIYTIADHKLLGIPVDKIDLTAYRGLTFKNWVYDWEIMNSLSPNVGEIVHLPSLFNMLKAGRGDFTLLEFPAKTVLDLNYDGATFRPIPGVKITIPDTRRLAVSKRAPAGLMIYELLNQGLAKMRAKGKIERLYREFGFINAIVRDWRILNGACLELETCR